MMNFESSSNHRNSLYDPDTFLSGDELDMQQCKDECANITPNFSNLDGVKIPARLLEEAKGVAVLTVAKGGFGVAGVEFGTGLVVARLGDNQQWSAPCAIGTAGMSWGALIGAQVSDHVFLLMTDAAVELMFNNDGNLQLGADIGVVSELGICGNSLNYLFPVTHSMFVALFLVCDRPLVPWEEHSRPILRPLPVPLLPFTRIPSARESTPAFLWTERSLSLAIELTKSFMAVK